MKSVTKLKDDARKHEQKEEWDKAIQAYLQVLKTGEEGEGELDLPLYNRVGDLYLRVSKPNDAVKYYVQAADRYADAGLYNNAIALCNKAMRYVPQQLDLLRKLGQYSASQGFLTDARRYFLDYAEKKFAAGQVGEALTALEEFAEASDDPEVRVMLARQLHAHQRTDEAVIELRKAHASRMKNGDQSGADEVRDEIESIAPGSFVADTPSPAAVAPSAFAPPPAASIVEEEEYGFAIEVPDDNAEDATSLDGFESTHMDAASADDTGDFQIQGFETTHAEPEFETAGESFQLDDFESTSHEDANITSDDLGLESTAFEAPSDIDTAPLADLQFDESSFGDDAGDGGLALPLLGGDDDDAFASGGDDALSLDGESSDSFSLDSFEIEQPEEDAADDASFGSFELPGLDAADEDSAEDDGHFELPMLEEAADESGVADGNDAGDFSGDFGGLALPTLRDEDEPAADFTLPSLDGGESDAPSLDDDADLDTTGPDTDDFGEYGRRAELVQSVEPSMAESTQAEDARRGADEADQIAELISADLAADEAAAIAADTDAVFTDDFGDDAVVTDDEVVANEEAGAGDGSGGWDPSALGFDEPVPAQPASTPPVAPSKGKAKDGSDYFDLGSFLTDDDDDDAGTRFRVQEKAPTGDEDRDFAELLSQFKQKVSENVSAEDSAAHYDLGLAFKEMGLIDEAISEFQIAMRAGDMRLRVYEELGHCFLEKSQYNIAEKVLKRALEMHKGDELEMIGVYYHLGRAYEGLGNRDAAKDAYERVLGLDINFQDVTLRLKRL